MRTLVESWLVRVWTLSCASISSLLNFRISLACFSSAVLYKDEAVDTKLSDEPFTAKPNKPLNFNGRRPMRKIPYHRHFWPCRSYWRRKRRMQCGRWSIGCKTQNGQNKWSGGSKNVPVVYLGGASGLWLGATVHALAFARRSGVTLHIVVVQVVQQILRPLQHGGVQLFRFGRPVVHILVRAHQPIMHKLLYNKKQTEGNSFGQWSESTLHQACTSRYDDFQI